MTTCVSVTWPPDIEDDYSIRVEVPRQIALESTTVELDMSNRPVSETSGVERPARKLGAAKSRQVKTSLFSAGLGSDTFVRAPEVDALPRSLPNILTGQPWKRQYDLMSPLRYPGSKRKMVPAIRTLIEGNIPRPKLFVEPFCGGASVALALLELDVVDSVVLADLDPLIAAFWRVAISEPQSLILAMHDQPITVRNWDHWSRVEPREDLWKAVKCLFLNRTTFSGILGGRAGPIGGREQLSQYKIDCRFDKHAIERRIQNVASLGEAGRILDVIEGPWQETLRAVERYGELLRDDETLLYLDPPYVKQASRLYGRSFDDADHRDLAGTLTTGTRHCWILSYDDEPLVNELYGASRQVRKHFVAHSYTMQGRRRTSPIPGREVIFTNLPANPSVTEVFQ